MRRPPDILKSLSGQVALAALALFALSGAGCGSDGGLAAPVVGSVMIEGPATLHMTDTATAVAIVKDSGGAVLNGAGVTWRSDAPHVVTVSRSGLLRALIAGHAQITATAGNHQGVLDIAVHEATALLSVAPAHAALIAGDTVTLRATPRTSAGLALDAGRVTWSSSDSTRARVDVAGVVTALGPGRVTISASYDGRVGTSEMVIHPIAASLTIDAPATTIPLRDTMPLAATVRDSSGAVLANRAITWQSLDPEVVVSESGVVKAMGHGEARIVASSVNVADTITLTVGEARVKQITVNAAAFYVAVGDTVRPLLRVSDKAGGQIFTRVVTWSSADESIAAAFDGVVSGRKAGRTRITVSSDGIAASFEVVVEGAPATVTFMQDSLWLTIGETAVPPVLIRDALGEVVRDYSLTYSTGDVAVAAPTTTGVRGVATGRTTIIAQFGEIADTAVLVVSNDDPIKFSFSNWDTPVMIGERAHGWVHVKGSYTYATGRTVRFRSSDPRIFTVSPDSAVVESMIRFEVAGLGIGAAHLIVEVDGRTARHDVVVRHVPLASLEIVGAPAILRPAQFAAIASRMVDVNGVVRTYPLIWRSLNTAVATVDANGVVTAISLGIVDIVAQRDTFADTVRISVQPDAAPTITGITPAVLAPGASAVIRGQGFSPVLGSNQVTVAGVPVSVTTANETELTVILPGGGYPCVPTGLVRVTVTSSGLKGDTLHSMRSARQQPLLPVGQSIVLTGTDAHCVELAPGAEQYLMTMSFGPTSAEPQTTVRVRGASSEPMPEPALAAGRMDSALRVMSRPTLHAAAPDDALRSVRAGHHREARAMLPALLRRFGPPATRAVSGAEPASIVGPAPSLRSPVVGQVVAMRVPLFEANNYCAEYSTVHARIVYVGQRAIVLEDVDAPLARTMDYMYRTMGGEFETWMLPVIHNNIGNPLARDAELGQNGRVTLLFSRAVNDYGTFGAFYSPCDMYGQSVLPASNETPVVYASVPATLATDFSSLTTTANWRRLIRTPLVHQAAHLAMDAERLALGLGPNDLWLDEALAHSAEEIYMRTWTSNLWKASATYDRTLFCEVRPAWPECADRPYGMYDLFASLYLYARENERRTPLAPTSFDDPTFIGSSWWLLRWAVDHYAVSEGAFLKSLVRTPLSGGAALVAQTGAPMSQMLADMGMTLVIPYLSWFPILRPQLTVRSWHWHNIFRGMEGDFTAFYGFPAQPRHLSNLSFDTGPIAMSGGEVVYFELPGNRTKNQTISITGVSQAAPTLMSLEIVRAK